VISRLQGDKAVLIAGPTASGKSASGASVYSLSMNFSENRYPPRIKYGAGFFRIMLQSIVFRAKA
jgi:hypothetical protein